MKQNKPNDGEELLKLKIQNNPHRAHFMLQLATHYYYLNRRPDMDSVAQRLSNEKEFPEGHLLLGDFYFFRAREYDHAQEQYEAAIKAFPKDKALYQKRLVELYTTRGNNSEANQLLTGILKDNPKDNDAIAMRAALMLTWESRANQHGGERSPVAGDQDAPQSPPQVQPCEGDDRQGRR